MRACWLKWVGRDWSISADYIWLNYSGANIAQQSRSSRANVSKIDKNLNDFKEALRLHSVLLLARQLLNRTDGMRPQHLVPSNGSKNHIFKARLL